MKRKKASQKQIGIHCQCQDRPVPIAKERLKTVQCPKCGKIYKTNKEGNICFNCQNKK